MKILRSTFLFTLVFFAAIVCFAQERFVLPVDEAKKDPSFFAFREKLITAVKKNDLKYFLSVVDENIKNGFGGEDGIKEFRSRWELDYPDPDFFRTFLPVITGGGSFSKEGDPKGPIFFAPYVFEQFPKDLDALANKYCVITGQNVNLRKEGDLKSAVVASLSYNIVKVDEENSIEGRGKDGEMDWYAVETLGGKKGFVKAEYVRSPLDYRAAFMKVKGKWKLTAFAAGD
jgi:hypothetical protein